MQRGFAWCATAMCTQPTRCHGGGEPTFLYADCCDGCVGAAHVAVEGFLGCPSAAKLMAS
uniref:Uncharacterized protein n=1 Tax=Arundo donax TaxID=35708 RepID=A0A0A9BCX0_ARUDO